MSANSAQHDLLYRKETDFGTDPSGGSKRAVITGTTLAMTRTKLESGSIRPDRQMFDVRPGNKKVGGDIGVELSYNGQRDWLEAVMCGTWTNVPIPATDTFDTSVADGLVTIAGTSAGGFASFSATVAHTSLEADITAMEAVAAGRFTIVDEGYGVFTVTSTNGYQSLTLTVHNAGANHVRTQVAPTAGPNSELKPGPTRRSFTIIRAYTDLTADSDHNPFHLFTGCEFNSFNLTVAPDTITKASFTLMGKDVIRLADNPSNTVTAASTNKGFDSFTGSVIVDDVEVASITQIALSVTNNMADRMVVFQQTTNEMKIGKTVVSGTLTMYFENSDFFNSFDAGENKSIQFTLVDPSNSAHTLIFNLPACQITAAQADAQGDNDITIACPFSAIYEDGAEIPDALTITKTTV